MMLNMLVGLLAVIGAGCVVLLAYIWALAWFITKYDGETDE